MFGILGFCYRIKYLLFNRYIQLFAHYKLKYFLRHPIVTLEKVIWNRNNAKLYSTDEPRRSRLWNCTENLARYNGKFREFACSRTVYFCRLRVLEMCGIHLNRVPSKKGQWMVTYQKIFAAWRNSWKFLTVAFTSYVSITKQRIMRYQSCE